MLCGGFSAEVRAKKMRQDDGAEFISDSLNTCGLLKRAALERKKSAGDETHAFLTCFTKVRLGASHHVLPSFNKIRTALKYHIYLRKELL